MNQLLRRLEDRRDTLVRRLRAEHDYKTRCQMNDALDQVIDEIERLTGDDSETSDRR
jgi:hypothetical protein